MLEPDTRAGDAHEAPDVRFGLKADTCIALAYVRYQMGMSAKGQKRTCGYNT